MIDPGLQINREVIQFDFGENWKSFSASLEPKDVETARTSFRDLFAKVPLEGRSFLDIGFGQGLGVCLADEAGARVHACDINPKCVEAMESTARFFPGFQLSPIPVIVGSILSNATSRQLKLLLASTERDGFDVVHSWGVLHHTGDMKTAVENAASLVKAGGHLVLAICNSHWSSPIWHWIKRTYVHTSPLLQKWLTALFVPVIFAAKYAVTRQNPLHQGRGMDFHHDVVDWVGGYPYEYRNIGQLTGQIEKIGFKTLKVVKARVPTGCNEFVFQRLHVGNRQDGNR